MANTIIVTFEDDATEEEMQKVKDKVAESGGTIKDVYKIIKGFSADMPEVYIQTLTTLPKVKHVEEDQLVTTQ